MAEYLKKEDDITKIIKNTVSPIEKKVEEQESYDLITDLVSNSETLVKGIILSEILGKPKSKR